MTRDASERERQISSDTTDKLRRIYAPFFLRRCKKDVFRMQSVELAGGKGLAADELPLKTDLVVWMPLSPK